MPDTDELAKIILEFRRQRGWEKHHLPKNLAISLVLEAVEFLELFQWTKDNQVPEDKREELEGELIDVLYWVLVIAHDLGIDLEKAFQKKMKKNRKKYPAKA